MFLRNGFNVVQSKDGYYIAFFRNNFPYYQDAMIVKILNITVEEYRQTLIDFNGDVITDFYIRNDIYFQNEQAAINCCEFLNLKYGLMMKLTNLP